MASCSCFSSPAHLQDAPGPLGMVPRVVQDAHKFSRSLSCESSFMLSGALAEFVFEFKSKNKTKNGRFWFHFASLKRRSPCWPAQPSPAEPSSAQPIPTPAQSSSAQPKPTSSQPSASPALPSSALAQRLSPPSSAQRYRV